MIGPARAKPLRRQQPLNSNVGPPPGQASNADRGVRSRWLGRRHGSLARAPHCILATAVDPHGNGRLPRNRSPWGRVCRNATFLHARPVFCAEARQYDYCCVGLSGLVAVPGAVTSHQAVSVLGRVPVVDAVS